MHVLSTDEKGVCIAAAAILPLLHPPVSALQGVAADVAAGQGLHAQGHGALELGGAIDGQASSQDEDQAGSGQAARDLSHALHGAQGAQLRTATWHTWKR
jgi:hypothetical protein